MRVPAKVNAGRLMICLPDGQILDPKIAEPYASQVVDAFLAYAREREEAMRERCAEVADDEAEAIDADHFAISEQAGTARCIAGGIRALPITESSDNG